MSKQQKTAVHIEMEMLNGERSTEPVPSDSRCSLKGVMILCLVGLLTIVSVCLLFMFFFKPVCDQRDEPEQTAGKVNFIYRLQEYTQKGQYDIFRVEKAGRYWIHGWLRRSTNMSADVRLVQVSKSERRTLQKNNKDGKILYFNIEALLLNNSTISLSMSQHLDGYFYVSEK